MLRITQNPSTNNNNHNENENEEGGAEEEEFRDIHALTPTVVQHQQASSGGGGSLPLPPNRQRSWDVSSRRSSNLSVGSDVSNSSENFTTMSREFNALVIAGSSIENQDHMSSSNNNNNLDRIGEEEGEADIETNPLAIVPDINPMPSPGDGVHNGGSSSLGRLMGSSTASSNNTNNTSGGGGGGGGVVGGEMIVHRVKKEEVEAKILAWQNAKIAKINNRFKREDAIITGWENEQIHKASSHLKKIERKLEEKKARAVEKMQNDIAKAHRKAEERKASSEGKRGTKIAKVLDVANLMRAVGRPPAKRSFF